MEPRNPLHSEVRARFGVLPSFFRLAAAAPEVATSLWGFARFGYLDNPLPSLFKERLFVSLSRFCEVRYCLSRHIGFLVGLGHPSGDPEAEPQPVEEVLKLLSRPLPGGDDLEPQLELLRSGERGPGDPGGAREQAIFDCASHVFLQSPHAPACLEGLRASLDPVDLEHLLVFLAFVHTAHFWTRVHPELELEEDVTALLDVQEELAACILAAPEGLPRDVLRTPLEERDALRQERRSRAALESVNATLREERERLRVTLESIGDAVVTTDISGVVSNMNGVAETLTGWTEDEARGQPLERVLHLVREDQREGEEVRLPDPAGRALREGVVVGRGTRAVLIGRDGTRRPIEHSAAPILDRLEKTIGCVLTFRDITERRRGERALDEKHAVAQFLAAVVDSSQDAIVTKTLGGIIRSWNASAERLFGYTAEEAIGRHVTFLIPPELAREEDEIIGRLRAGERIEHFDTERIGKDGRRVHVSLTISPLKDAAGRVVGASKVARDITDRKRSEAALRQAAAELFEADRRKDEFLAILAHELRNPLAPLRNGLHLVRLAGGDQAALDRACSLMERQVVQMVRLIDDLMDVSRISRGKIELRPERTELAVVVSSAIEASRPLIEEHRQQVDVDLPDQPLILEADLTRLAQVFMNLLNNAAKYSEPGGRIRLSARVDPPWVEVSVEDQGIGIPFDQQSRIFELFGQVDRSLHRSHGGLGIGLSLAKQLVEMHGGTIEVHSDGPGKGARFTVRLPLVQGATGADVDTPCAAPGKASSSALRILIVDDNRDAADSLALMLQASGYATRVAYDGQQGVALAEDFRPRVALFDIGLPRLDGYQACRQIREQPWGQGMELVAITGWGQAEHLRRSREAGFDHHLVKPIDPAALIELLARLDEPAPS